MCSSYSCEMMICMQQAGIWGTGEWLHHKEYCGCTNSCPKCLLVANIDKTTPRIPSTLDDYIIVQCRWVFKESFHCWQVFYESITAAKHITIDFCRGTHQYQNSRRNEPVQIYSMWTYCDSFHKGLICSLSKAGKICVTLKDRDGAHGFWVALLPRFAAGQSSVVWGKEFENSLKVTLLVILNKHLMPLNKHTLLMLWDAIWLMWRHYNEWFTVPLCLRPQASQQW